MPAPIRAICFHGHFYQPPREDPWLGVVEPEPSAAPDRDWNARITRECYGPAAAARILDAAGRLCDLVNIYEWTSFDFGPTLLSWLAAHAPDLFDALRRADGASRVRTGWGNAWAQAYGHPILPLSSLRDVRTQVVWGRRDFEHRFGRPPDGMWLPEMAVDLPTLAALADAGITLTMLAPHQARRIRPLGAGDDAWRAVAPGTLDVSRLYRCLVPGGRFVDVLFRHEGISHDIAFDGLLKDGAALAARVRAAASPAGDRPTIVGVAVDGETYGHHHRFGEMALGYALHALAQEEGVALVGPAAFRAILPPADEVEIVEGTSWSCPHGVERWRADCGCRTGRHAGWTQAWRTPLRQAIDWLRDELAALYETRAGALLRDPWGARDRYVECLLEPGRTAGFVAAEAAHRLSPVEAVQVRRALELARHALMMQTSCGWFFDELTGVEPAIILRQAARAIGLASGLGRRLEEGFVERLEPARSNVPGEGSGADVYRRLLGAAATPVRVAATGALLAVMGHPGRVPGYEIAFSAAPDGGRLVADARVTELATGATSTIPLLAERVPGGGPRCQTGESIFTLTDLFGVQRERLLDAVAREASAASRAGRRTALVQVRPILDPLLAGETPLPFELAVILGYEEAEAMATALEAHAVSLRALVAQATALRRRGVVFPARWLAGRIGRVLEEKVGALPEKAEDALMVLDLAAAAGVTLDLAGAQVRALSWWMTAPPAAVRAPALALLAERLHLATERRS